MGGEAEGGGGEGGVQGRGGKAGVGKAPTGVTPPRTVGVGEGGWVGFLWTSPDPPHSAQCHRRCPSPPIRALPHPAPGPPLPCQALPALPAPPRPCPCPALPRPAHSCSYQSAAPLALVLPTCCRRAAEGGGGRALRGGVEGGTFGENRGSKPLGREAGRGRGGAGAGAPSLCNKSLNALLIRIHGAAGQGSFTRGQRGGGRDRLQGSLAL